MLKKISDVMQRKMIAVLPSDSIEECAVTMSDYDVRALPVISAGRIKGIVTRKNIATKVIAEGMRPKDIRASEIMIRDISYLSPIQRIQDAVNMMSCEKLRVIPVVENDMMEGSVSVKDIVRFCSRDELLELVNILL